MGVKPLLLSVAFSISLLMGRAQGSRLITNHKGLTLSYDREFFLYCEEYNTDIYKLTVYFANNTGKTIISGGAIVWHELRNRVGLHCSTLMPRGGFQDRIVDFGIFKSITNIWPAQSPLKMVYYIEVPQGQAVPEPAWHLDQFTFEETPKTSQPATPQWSPWVTDNCFPKLKYKYMGKELLNLNYQYHYYFQAVNNYTETIFFVLSLKDVRGKERFGTRRSIAPGQTIEFVEKMDQDYIEAMAVEKVCFKVDDSKYLPCDAEREAKNGDKYGFKGTKHWKNSDKIERLAMVPNGLITVDEFGFPSSKYNEMKPNYKRVAPDRFKAQGYYAEPHNYDSVFFTLVNSNKILWQTYKNNEVNSYPFSLIATYTAESLPQATNKTITAANATGSWKSKERADFGNCLKLKINGNVIILKYYGVCGMEDALAYQYTAKKTSINTYEFKEYGGTCRLVFLSPTSICLSFVNNDYVSVVYYYKGVIPKEQEEEEKPAPPIVKPENKTVPVTENKTKAVTDGFSDAWYGEGNKINPMKLKTTSSGLLMYYDESNHTNFQLEYKKISENQFQAVTHFNSRYTNYTTTHTLSFVNNKTCLDEIKITNSDGSTAYDKTYYHSKAIFANENKVVNWINSKQGKEWDVHRLVITEEGVYDGAMMGNFVINFYKKTTTPDSYLWVNGIYKTYLKLKSPNSMVFEYCDQNGQVNQTEYYIPKSK